MCLIVVGWRVHPDYPLVVAANRDEFYARPTLPLAQWPDAPHVYAGRDQEAPAHVAPRTAQVEPDPFPVAGQSQQVEGQQRRHQREDDPGQLVGQVEPGPVGGDAGVDLGGLLVERYRPGQLLGDRQDRVHRRLAQRHPQHQQHLPARSPRRHQDVRGLAHRDSLTVARWVRANASAEANACSRPARSRSLVFTSSTTWPP